MDVEKDANLINCMDSINAGKAFTAYIRYTLKLGKTHVALLTVKAKLNPVGGQMTLRSEMDGHTLGSRDMRLSTDALKSVSTRISKIYMLRL